jgi:hypothetical protein
MDSRRVQPRSRASLAVFLGLIGSLLPATAGRRSHAASRAAALITVVSLVTSAQLFAGPATAAVNASPEVTILASDLNVDERGTATANGTVLDPELGLVDWSADRGTMYGSGPYPDGSFTWWWSMAAPDGPSTVDVTVTFTDTGGAITTVPLHVVVTNAPPVVFVSAPHFVPIGDHIREFTFGASDVIGDSVTSVPTCGPAVFVWRLTDTVQCTSWTAGANAVGATATDEDGGSTTLTADVIGSTAITAAEQADTTIASATEFGGALAILDINGDGINDLVVGNGYQTTSPPQARSGVVAVFLGPIALGALDLSAASGGTGFRILRPAPDDQFGRTLANAGDVNGDGIDDLLVGAPTSAPFGRVRAGAAWVVFGSKSPAADIDLTTASASVAVPIQGATSGDELGRSLAGGGDVNGDGFDDVVIGSPFSTLAGSTRQGAAFVVFGGAGLTAVDTASLGARGFRIQEVANLALSRGLAIGRMDDDAYADVVIGSPARIDIVYGSSTPVDLDTEIPPPGATTAITESSTKSEFQILHIALGDINHDGHLDVVAGRSFNFDGHTDVGTTVVIFGRPDRSNRSAIRFGSTDAVHITGDRYVGQDVAVGDFDRDGRLELATFGGKSVDRWLEGAAYQVALGSNPTDVNLDVLDGRWRRLDGWGYTTSLNGAVAAGDLTGDGAAEFVVGWAPSGRVSIERGIPLPDSDPPVGSIVIGDGGAFTNTTAVSLATAASDAVSGVNQVALSNDGTTWTTRSYSAAQDWTLSPGDGTKTVWAKWLDGAGNWSTPTAGTIVLDTVAPIGSILIAAGAGTTNTTSVVVDVAASDATSGVSEVALSNDDAAWTMRSYAASQSWVLVSGDGLKTVFAKWRDLAGHWSDPVSDTILLDTTVPATTVPDTVAPVATAPTKTLVVGSSLTSGRPTVRFAWSGSDAGSGIGHYELALSTDGGAYATVSSVLTSPTLDRALAVGHSYRAAVRATDVAGNVGAWAYGSAFRLTAYQESSSAVHWSGIWRTGSSTSFWGGHDRYASAAGSKASLTFTGRSFAWVGSVGPSRGWAKVYVNGVLVKSVNLNAATNANRRILFATTWSTARSRTITIRISATAGHPRGDVDAFIVGS